MPKSCETHKKVPYVVNIVHTKSFDHVKVAKWETPHFAVPLWYMDDGVSMVFRCLSLLKLTKRNLML